MQGCEGAVQHMHGADTEISRINPKRLFPETCTLKGKNNLIVSLLKQYMNNCMQREKCSEKHNTELVIKMNPVGHNSMHNCINNHYSTFLGPMCVKPIKMKQ